MNRGNSLVQQQMMARRRSHSFWMPSLTPSQEMMMFNSSSSSLSSSPIDFPKPSNAMVPNCHDLPEAWSQPLQRGFMEEEEGCTAYSNNINSYHNYQDLSALGNGGYVGDEVIKQEDTCGAGGYNTTANNQYNFHGKDQAEAQAAVAASRSHSWSNNNTTTTSITTKVEVPGSSPRYCLITSFSSSSSNNNNNNSNSILDFSNYKNCTQERNNKHHHGSNDHQSSDQCNRSYSGAALKKARIQASSAESSLKVRKEKLGDRIAALHQLVSPFGKTDTASVLSEAIAHIRFLQAQVEALSSPYLGGGSRKKARQCGGDDDGDEARDLRSRGLCLVPAPFTLHGGS